MLSKSLETTLTRSLAIARGYQHEYATFEHLLLALLENEDACSVFQAFNVDIMSLYSQLDLYLKYELGGLVNPSTKEAKPTAGFQRVLHRAAIHGHATGHDDITGAHILAELFFESESYAVRALRDRGISRTDVVNYITKHAYAFQDISPVILKAEEVKNPNIIITQRNAQSTLKQNDILSLLENPQPKNESGDSIITTHCINLNKQAERGDIDNLIGRGVEIQRTIEILCRRQKNNVILVGEPGVGKTAIAEGLALRIVQKDVPEILSLATVYALDLGSLVSGTRYRGDFEDRIKNILQELKKDPNAILFIDEIHNIIGAGSTTTGSLDASNLLKPALARGDIRCIGATTFQEYHKNFEKDAALARRFQKVIVQEPSEEQTIEILKGLKEYYEDHHDCKYDESAIISAVTLSQRYITDRYLPDKAIDLLDEAGSRKKISKDTNKHITDRDIEMVVADIAHIPSVVIATDEASKLKALEKNLKSVIYGQDKAIESLCTSVKLSKAGLRRAGRPIGCYLFTGPTGVGKTELAKQLAHFCSMELVRYDMSEYSEAHSVARLVGTPPGYVGFEQGGLLTEDVSKHPYAVVLLDEMEKANPDVYNLLLQVMDHGRLTDSTGKSVNFAHTIVIMTSNSGASEMHKTSIGFGTSEDSKLSVTKEVVDKTFSPEFRSRLDEIIFFNPITDKEIRRIVDKNIDELARQIADKKVIVNADSKLRKYLVDQCSGSNKGARVLDRIMDIWVKQKIADAILFGELKNGGEVSIGYSGGEVSFEFKSAKQMVEREKVESLI